MYYRWFLFTAGMQVRGGRDYVKNRLANKKPVEQLEQSPQ